MISKKLVAASILAAMGTSAHAIGFKAGEWEMDLSGSVNAYYNTTSCDNAGVAFNAAGGILGLCGGAGTGQDQTSIQNGLLPGFIIFTASTKQAGYDLKCPPLGCASGRWRGNPGKNESRPRQGSHGFHL